MSITGLSDAITVQYCLIHEGLNRSGHGYASIIGGERSTRHHNLFAHHVSRVPRFAGVVHSDFRHNVLYNWGHTAGYGQFERVNYLGNFLQPGPSTTQKPLQILHGTEVVGAGSLYLDGNIIVGEPAATEDNWRAVGFDRQVLAATPFAAPAIAAESASAARVLDQVGARPAERDAVDARLIAEVRAGESKIIDHARDVAPRME